MADEEDAPVECKLCSREGTEELSDGSRRCSAHSESCPVCGSVIDYRETYCPEHTDYFMCEGCGEHLDPSDYAYDGYCDSCWEDENDEPSWFSDNPYPIKFLNDQGILEMEEESKNIYLGVELELECTGGFEEVSAGHYKFLWHKDDASLSRGVETCSYPATLKAHHSHMQWEKFLSDNRDSLEERPSCGLHVHINRGAFNYFGDGTEKFILFIYTHEKFVNALCRRKPGPYRQKEGDKPSNYDRYQIVNIIPRRTIEFRQPAGTSELNILYATIEFCDALVRFCDTHTLNELRSEKAVRDFMGFISDREEYADLTTFMNKRGYYEDFDSSIAQG